MTTQTDSTQPSDTPREPREEKKAPPQPARAETTEQWQAALSVMHPDASDPDWRQYHAAWGG